MNLDIKTNGLIRLPQSFHIILRLWHLSCDVVYNNSMTEFREAHWIVLITVSFLKCKAQCSLDKKQPALYKIFVITVKGLQPATQLPLV